MLWIWKDIMGNCPNCNGTGYVQAVYRIIRRSRTVRCPRCSGAGQIVVGTATWKYILVGLLALVGLALMIKLTAITFVNPVLDVSPTPTGMVHGLKMASPVALDPPPPVQEKFLELIQWLSAFLFADSFGRAAIYMALITFQVVFAITMILVGMLLVLSLNKTERAPEVGFKLGALLAGLSVIGMALLALPLPGGILILVVEGILAILIVLPIMGVGLKWADHQESISTPGGSAHKRTRQIAFGKMEHLSVEAVLASANNGYQLSGYSPMEIYQRWSRQQLAYGFHASVEDFVTLWNAGNPGVHALLERRK